MRLSQMIGIDSDHISVESKYRGYQLRGRYLNPMRPATSQSQRNIFVRANTDKSAPPL
jgi:hypothetical protein